MTHLPFYVVWFGGIRKDKTFRKIELKLGDTAGSKDRIYRTLTLRFWCHAHLYAPVLSLIFLNIIPGNNAALTLLMVSIGSLSFAICESFGGAYADKKGCKRAIQLGIKLMIVLMGLYGIITVLSMQQLFTKYFAAPLVIAGQLLIGLPLALINGADTELTKKISRQMVDLDEEDSDYLEGICTKLKYSGVAIAAFWGCLLYVMFHTLLDGKAVFVSKAFIFWITAIGQLLALRHLSSIEEPSTTILRVTNVEPNRELDLYEQKTLFVRLVSSLQSILADKALVSWVVLIASIDGWLLFSKYYFELDALKNSIKKAKDNPFLILLIPIIYWLLSAFASFGGSFFNRWRKKVVKVKNGNTGKLKNGNPLDIPSARLTAAGAVLSVMMISFAIHLFMSLIFSKYTINSNGLGIWAGVVSIFFFAFFQFLRGFSQPLLKTTMSNLTAKRALPNPTTILSISTGVGRFCHLGTTLLFTCILYFIEEKNKLTIEALLFKKALAATVVIIILIIIVLNVISSIALDRRSRRNYISPPPIPLYKEIQLLFKSRTFRSIIVKGAFFITLAMSEILAPKICNVGSLDFNAGAIPYALTFLLVDIISETEGKKASRQLWLSGIFIYLLMGLLVFIAVQLPGTENPILENPFDEMHGQKTELPLFKVFDLLFGKGVLRFVFAGLCSFTVAQYLDIWLFLLIKRVTHGRALWLRNNLSTFLSQTIDTLIFTGIAFWGLPIPEMFALVIGQLVVKWIFAFLDTPLLYLAVKWIGRDERER